MRIECALDEAEMARISAIGPAIVVSNYPFGILESAVLGAVISRVRPDLKIVINVLLREIEELQGHCIFVDPFGGKETVAGNAVVLALAAPGRHAGHLSRWR